MRYFFAINISAKEFLPYYQGKTQVMVVTATNGTRVQFPAMRMRKYLTSSGIKGTFCMETENNKFKLLTKLS
jgi:hypothetical protein